MFPRPPKKGQIPFLRNTYSIRHSKKDNGNSTINHFIYEFHIHSNKNTCPTETEFLTCYPLSCPAGKDLPLWKERMIHSIRIDIRVQLHCIVRICVVYLKEVDLLASLIVQSSSWRASLLLGPQRQNKKRRAWCQQFITEEGTHWARITNNTNIIEKNCLFCILSPVLLLPRVLLYAIDRII